jgi:hypothetical protein
MIVRRTRVLVKKGYSLKEIKKSFSLKRGPFRSRSVEYANVLIDAAEQLGGSGLPQLSLPKPYCAVFTNFKRWQI